MTPREKKEVKRNNFHASLYKRLGESIEKLWDLGLNAEWLKLDEEIFEGSFVENPSMTRALSLGASAAPSIGWLGGLAKLTKSTTLASVMLAGADADDIYFEARKAGASQNKALGLFAVGTAGTAAFDKYGFEQLFSQKVTAPLAKRVVNSMLSEGVTEGTQTLWQNMVKKYGYDDSQELWEAVIESVIGGALSGGTISAANAGYVRLQDVRGRLQEKGMSENGLDQVQEALIQEMGFHREGLEPLFQTRIEQSLNKLDDSVRQSEETAEVKKAQQIKADLEQVYNKVFDRIKTSDTDKVAAAQAKVVQGVALWGSQELGISPLEYFEQRFPRIERVAYRDFARRLNEAKRAGEVAEINLYEALKNPALLKGQKVKDTRQSLTQFLKQNGGLKDFGGELKAMDADKQVIGLINNKNGRNLDDMALAAWEAGYFPQSSERPTVNELLDAIGEELGGRKRYNEEAPYSLEDEVNQLADDLDRINIDWRNMEAPEIEMAVDAYMERQRAYNEEMGQEDIGSDELPWFQGQIADHGRGVELTINSSEEMQGLSDEDFKNKMLDTLKSFKGNKIFNQSLNGDIEIRTSSIKKYKSFFADKNKRLIVPYIPELLGKASSYLKRVFDAFMNWMRNLYKTAKELNVKLNDEVRGVYGEILGGADLDRYMDAPVAEVLGQTKRYWKAKREAMDDIYKQNVDAKKASARLFKRGRETMQNVYTDMRNYLSDAIVPLEEEIKQISPELYNMNRRLEIDKLQKTSRYYKRIKGFVDGMQKMDAPDFYTFDLALKNRDVDTVQRLLEKYALTDGFAEVRNILDDLREQMIDVGVDVAYMPDYFPRKIKDADGLLDYVEQEFGGRPEYSIIQKMIEEKRKDGRIRTKEDEAQIVNSLIRGYAGGISIAKIGNVKERSIDVVDQYMNRFYKVSTDALTDYISGAVQMIENKKYFGRETKELQNLRKMVANRETTIADYKAMEPKEAKWKEIKTRNYKIGAVEAQIRNTYDKDVKAELQDRKTKLEAEVEFLRNRRAEQVKEIAINRMEVELAQVKKEVDDLADSKIENSVGNLLLEMAEQGKISHTQELRLKELLLARFSNQGLGNEFLRLLRDGGYIWTLGNFESAITQFGDLGTSAYKNGLWNTAFEYVKAWQGKSEITINDLGLEKIIQDGGYADTSAWSRALDKVLKYTGFEKMDKIAKQTLVNSAVQKARADAKAESPELEAYLRHEFGEKWVDVKEDLKTGAVTDEIMEYAMFQLLDVQPITIDQMPRYYAEGGKKRLFYMMKSYFIKQLNEYRKICFETAKSNPRKAVVDMTRLTVYLMLFNAGADVLKDLLFGRPVNVPDSLVDNIFIGGSINRYQAMSVKREGLFKTLQKQLLFPVMLDELVVDILSDKEVKDWNTWKNVPLVGRPYYWWFGGGHLKTLKEEKKARNERRNQRRRRRDD